MTWQELEERACFLAALTDKYSSMGAVQEPGEGGPVPLQLAKMKEEDALLLVQACERSRQARQRLILMASLKRQGQAPANRSPSPAPVRFNSCPSLFFLGPFFFSFQEGVRDLVTYLKCMSCKW